MSTTPDTNIVFRPVVVRTPAWITLTVWLWRLLVAVVKTVWRHPVACSGLGLSAGSVYALGVHTSALLFITAVCAVVVWAAIEPVSCSRRFKWPAVAWWRWMWVYRRRWRGVMAVAGLGRSIRGRVYLPELVKVSCDRWADRVRVRLLKGQDAEEWAARSGNLAHGFGAVSCRIEVPKPGWVLLTFPRRDALAQVINDLPYTGRPVVDAVHIGLREDGLPFYLKLHGTHVLIAGATGSGKGSWEWAIVGALRPAVREGIAQVWGLDPKRMELSYGRALFSRYAATPVECAELLEAAVATMQERADRYAGVRRDHEATMDDPFIVVMVDEIAFLTAYVPDKQIRARVMAALATLTTQGRSVGVCVVAALQDPRKDVLSIRNLFPDRVALRLDEAEQVDMVLGDGARDRGALADQIPRDPRDPSVGAGVGYVRVEGAPTPIRVRAMYVRDFDIRRMVLREAGVLSHPSRDDTPRLASDDTPDLRTDRREGDRA
ncbi:S-DNA-T family DNA segregation ATPase FtsK/SpoIIIE [Thermocatellispora tengchongensis]|uniref:S-DNA-T family DNA segregation ATPase FtsK/SpoIIIE n=1 Tax=Thermocatellispora tengchongensis TaxID=1073253 RepID=A0A840P3P3_9ACTN|nr:FtsK/SpoIIIE domain-containing protein [Thermocatellispora tengchongensis]MBB5130665.1 S-DNA-T family DNA segregation ATPase FtsK/SpoIIIE [Thermocatellispora tengchongensis]